MVNRKTVSAFTVAALLTCAVPVKSLASSWIAPVIGQAAPSFPVPTSVDKGTEVTISSSSDNMNAISEALQQGFEGEYNNSKVSITTKDANAAIQDVLNGNAELAAISRPLTAEEKAKGLIEVPVRREKIAIVVSKDNPFAQSITGSQFAQIFRGEIKDWSEVGGSAGPIKLVDRPATSETRQALSPYPVFTTAPFNAAAGATTLEADTTEAVVTALGNDGVSYILVGELAGQPDIKALELHKTPPSDPRYPFSQPYSFVYAGGASPAVSAFLGYATGNPGQAAVNNAGVSGLGLIPDAGSGTSTATAGAEPSAESADTTEEGSQTAESTTSPDADTAEGATPDTETEGTDTSAAPEVEGDGATLEASDFSVAGPDGKLGTADDIDIAGPDGILGTADDIKVAGPDGELGTADDIDIAGPDGILGTADDVDLAGPDGTFGTADDLKFGSAAGGLSGFGNVANKGRWWWLLLPLAGLGLLIWAAGKRGSEEETGYIASADRDDRIRSHYDGDADFDGGRSGLGGLNTDLEGGKVGRTGLGKVAAGTAAVAGGAAAAGAGLAGRAKGKAGDITMDLQDGVSDKVGSGIGGIKGGVDGIRGSLSGGVDKVKGGVNGGIDGVKGNIAGVKGSLGGGIDGLKGNVQGGINDVKGNIGSGVDGVKGSLQDSGAGIKGAAAAGLGAAAAGIGNLRGKVQDGIDGAKSGVQGSIDGSKSGVQGSIDGVQGSIGNAKEGVQGSVEGLKGAASSTASTSESWLDRAKQRINEATEQVKDTAADIKDDVTNND
ncbi:MAG: substrate-binding domain-containing protein [Cyanobacteria bacterium J06560_2]